ncbi:MAG: sugar-transfer associated ATP-grasp domain-containing protein [Fibrobacter sp.]|nr:sugar-transfer associated ATP-grasp domain-containing protein [Fibrobacter sp.]
MKLYASEDEAYQIRTGREIVDAYPEIYNPWIIQDIKQKLESCAKIRPDIAGGRSIEDMFAIATYDYWQYGIGTTEEFFNELLGASDKKKREYLTYRGRFLYIDYLNKKEDMHLLRNKWHAYQLLKDAYKREVLLLESEQDFPAFAAFCQRHPTFVVKPVGLGQSLGVRKVEVGDADLRALFNQLFTEIETENGHWNSGTDNGVLVEELIEQGEEMAMLHPASVNSVRMYTINFGDGDIRMWYPCIRIGTGGNFIAAGAVGSILAGINIGTGVVDSPGADEFGRTILVHPGTHIPIKGIRIPRWRQLCQKAIEMAERVPTLRYVGWDFVYDKHKEWIVMEGNENAEFLTQIIYHVGEREEFEHFIGYHPTKEYWWQGKYPSRFENIESEV